MAQNGSGPLLFVNKTSRSASLSNNRSDQASRKKINQHVQRTRDLDKERNARIQRLKPNRLAHRSGPTRVDSRSEALPATSLPTPPSTPLVSTSSVEDAGTVTNDDEDGEQSSAGSDLAKVIPERGTVEPFGVYRVFLDNERYRILQYFVLEMFPVISRTDTPAFFTGPVSPGQPAVTQMIRDCLTDEMPTYALLTASSARMKFLTRAPFSQADLPERFADITMQLLRRYLAQNKPVDERLILVIFFLWATETYRRNWKAVRTHQEMIKFLYKTQLGGFHSLSYHLRKMIWFGDRFQATATATPPVIEESWEPQEISPAVVSRVLKAIAVSGQVPMGTAFADYYAFFNSDFQALIAEVLELACIVQCSWTKVREPYPDRDWVNGRSHALIDKLLFFKGARLEKSSGFAILLQDCVRLAMITWLAFVGSPTTTGMASQSVKDNIMIRVAVDARPLRQQFAALIEHVHEAVSDGQQRSIGQLFLWIAGLGAVASALKENIDWFCERFRELADKLDVHTWTAFTLIGKGFLWLDRLEVVNNFRLTKILERQPLEV